ncbi:MAG: gamma-glutamylcyclotransferase family protein [Cyanobium sp.]
MAGSTGQSPQTSPPDAGETLLFVYGTLKRGQSNHTRLQAARWVGEAILEGACLFDLGPFPMAIAGDGRIRGELYALPMEALDSIDAFEGAPRLYQRHWRPLTDGRQAWVYLGRPRQVRHSHPLPGGQWPVLVAFLLALLPPGIAGGAGFDTLATCQAWRRSHGVARVELGNSIGAAHFLTKRIPFQESLPEAPVDLYSPADLHRICRL